MDCWCRFKTRSKKQNPITDLGRGIRKPLFAIRRRVFEGGIEMGNE